jgi:hypothetical protein
MHFYALDTPNIYFRRLGYIDLNVSGVKDRLKNCRTQKLHNYTKKNFLIFRRLTLLLSLSTLTIKYHPITANRIR